MWKKLNPIKLKTGDYILISTLLLVAVLIYGVYALQPFHDEMPAGEAHAQIQVDLLGKETCFEKIGDMDRGFIAFCRRHIRSN